VPAGRRLLSPGMGCTLELDLPAMAEELPKYVEQPQPLPLQKREAIPQDQLDDPLDIRCQFCPGQTFRRSRLRARDIFPILMMRYPARCIRCGQRQAVSFLVAGVAVPSNVKQARVQRNTATWKDWTGKDATPLANFASMGTGSSDQNRVAPVAPGLPERRRVESAPARPVAKPVERAPAAEAPKAPSDENAIW
jgi:hypothetical protein